MDDVIRLSSKWILCVEYESPEEEEVNYRGIDGALWKRPYSEMYKNKGLICWQKGFLKPEDGFDNCVYSLFQKPTSWPNDDRYLQA